MRTTASSRWQLCDGSICNNSIVPWIDFVGAGFAPVAFHIMKDTWISHAHLMAAPYILIIILILIHLMAVPYQGCAHTVTVLHRHHFPRTGTGTGSGECRHRNWNRARDRDLVQDRYQSPWRRRWRRAGVKHCATVQ